MKKSLLFLLLTLLFYSCEKDFEETTTIESQKNQFSSRIVSLNDIPKIKNYIKTTIEDVGYRNMSDGDLKKAIFDKESIIETVDSNKIINYSIFFIFEETKENIFYNLVINELPTGERTSYIFKHISNIADFQRFKESNFNFNYFKGYSEMSLYDGSTIIVNRSGDDECPEIYLPSANEFNSNNVGGGGGSLGYNSTFNQTIVGYNYFPSFGSISVQVGNVTYYQNGGTSTATGGGDPCNCYSPSGFGYFFAFEILKHFAKPATANRDTNGDCPEVTPPGGVIPINPPKTINPCFTLKNLANPDRGSGSIKPSVDLLKQKVNSTNNNNEIGFSTRKIGNFDGTFTYTNTPITSSNNNNIEFPMESNCLGGGHSHPIDSYPLYSFGDIKLLRNMFDTASPSRNPEVFYLLVSKHPTTGIVATYVLKVDDFTTLDNAINATWNHPNYAQITDDRLRIQKIHDKQAERYSKCGGDYEKSFLQQFGLAGISLYKASNEELTNWNKLKLEANPTNPSQLIVTSTPCN